MFRKFLITISGMLTISELISLTKGYIAVEVGLAEDVLNYKKCHYNGNIFRTGRFQVAPCVWCECSQDGKTKCWAETCPDKDPECIKYDILPGECCPRCSQYGCKYNDTVYKRGANIITHTPCKKCYCPWETGSGGEAVCLDIHCPAVYCVDSYVPTGKCCPTCPNGNNCWLKGNDLIIPTGRHVWVDKCHLCHCPNITVPSQVGHNIHSSWDMLSKEFHYDNNKLKRKLKNKTRIANDMHAVCVYQKSYACDEDS